MTASSVPAAVQRYYTRLVVMAEAVAEGWLLGLVARLVFAGVLLFYFWNSAATKIGPGLFGFLTISDGAYIQILPGAMEAAGYDASRLPAIPDGLIVVAGTYAEFVLPLLVVLGLFTRLSALGMMVFVLVQSVVDIIGHGADAETVGSLFDRVPDSQILDQRLLWGFLLLYLVVRGGGLVSLDGLLRRFLLQPRELSAGRHPAGRGPGMAGTS